MVRKFSSSMLLGIFILIGILSIYFVVAAYSIPTLNTPAANANISGTYLFNVTLGAGETAANVTFYHNQSGSWTSFCLNTTATGNEFTCSNDTSNLPDGTYAFNATAVNASDTISDISLSVTVDNTPPAVLTFYNTVNNGYYADSTVLNVSVSDATIGMGDVYFNITNSTGDQVNWTKASSSGVYYNMTLFTTSYTDGVYTITVYANDSLDNQNHSKKINITMDNTHPAPSALTSSSATTTSLTITFSGADGTCTADRSGATISGSTLTETGLSCGTSYSYTITCTDTAGNAGSSSATSFSTSSCGGVADTTPPFYTNTYIVTAEQFQQGYTKEIAVKHRAKVKVGASYHYVGIKALTASTATIEITSEPVEVILDVGEEAKIDVTEDGYYDIYVKLIDLVNNKANVLIKEIYEEIPEGEGDIATSGEITNGEEDEEVEETNLTWLWISIGVLVVVGGLALLLKMKKQKSSGLKKQ